MAKGTDKKKGPRGKKAREARKLERRWGEEVNENELKSARIRKGIGRLTEEESRSRITSKTPSRALSLTHPRDKLPTGSFDYSSHKRRKITDSVEDSVDEEQPLIDPTKASLQYLLKSIHQKSRSKRLQYPIGETYSDDNGSDDIIAEDEEDDWNESHEPHSDVDSIDDDEAEKESHILPSVSSKDEDSDDMSLSVLEQANTKDHLFFQHFFPKDTELTNLDLQGSTSTNGIQNMVTQQLNPSLQLQISDQVQQYGDELDLSHDNCQQMSFKHFQICLRLLTKNWKNVNSSVFRDNIDAKDRRNAESSPCHFSTLQSVLYPFMAQYADVLFTCETRQNKESIRNLILFHTLNHVLTSNRLISRNNKHLKNRLDDDENSQKKKKKKTNKKENNNTDLLDDESKWRDQGYTRPKVLILLPTKGVCLLYVRKMLQLLGQDSQVDHLERFQTEYCADQDSPVDSDQDEKKRRRKSVLKEKGQDWLDVFGDDVNSEDDFKLGISFQHVNFKMKGKDKATNSRRNVHVKLYSEFYHSDMIVASPLALKINNESDDKDHSDTDFLSSIDICIVYDCDVLLMQNWDHLNSVFGMINQQPKKIQGIDFSRVRNYFLAGLASRFRQLIVVSKFADPNIISTFKKFARSVSGQVKLRRKCTEDEASICDVSVRVQQVFQRVPSESFLSQGDDRLKYFTNKVLPHILHLQQKHTMIFIPSYFDFTAVRNVLLKKEASFVSVTEYARTSEISRGRARFLQGRKNIMLYTGRSFFFMRHFIKGIRHLIFFGLPEQAEFYPLLVNMMSPGSSTDQDDGYTGEPHSCLCLFTKYDAHALERIVGMKHCDLLMKEEKTAFLFNS